MSATATKTRKPAVKKSPVTKKVRPVSHKPKADQLVADNLVAALEEAMAAAERGEKVTAPWNEPYLFKYGLPTSGSTAQPYRGINPFILMIEQAVKGYETRFWATYNRIQELGGQVRKGEKGTYVVYWVRKTAEELRPGETKLRRWFFPVLHSVFNMDQADWTNPNFEAIWKLGKAHDFEGTVRVIDDGDTEAMEAVLAGYATAPQVVSEDQSVAYYSPRRDVVNMPRRENIAGRDEYFSTLYHELVHSSGHASRLDREGITNLVPGHRGTLYSFEELVAEMGAAMICAHVGITTTFDNSVAYLAHWASFLRSEPEAALKAAGKAQRAVDYILGVTWDDDNNESEA